MCLVWCLYSRVYTVEHKLHRLCIVPYVIKSYMDITSEADRTMCVHSHIHILYDNLQKLNTRSVHMYNTGSSDWKNNQEFDVNIKSLVISRRKYNCFIWWRNDDMRNIFGIFNMHTLCVRTGENTQLRII